MVGFERRNSSGLEQVLNMERKSLVSRDMFDNPDVKLRYEAYSRLQAAAVAFGETFQLPEIVAIGGQSDGKSSLLEAFLGYRFNVREVEMGTRRPLIVQMVHDPSALEPRCRLQEEKSEEYGPVITPETAVAEAIMRRTEEHLKELGGVAVSSKPIVMRAEYAFCPNLTIVDTPGFILKGRNGEADSTPDDIMTMVKAQVAPPHRLILFLQQSSVEWASSLWLRVVQEVDPSFQRTVIVASKFDNRLKEFAERWEVDKYLSATGYLPATARPFFVTLPKDRTIQTSSEWRRQMQEVDYQILKFLRENIKGGFDEERFGNRIGFTNLKRYLEEELARRYREAAPATLALLNERCEAGLAELRNLDARLAASEDVATLRKSAMQLAAAMANQVQQLLCGSAQPDPAVHGMTTDEERIASRIPQWPGISSKVQPPNAGLRLLGGASFERCLNEFQEAAHALKFPSAVAKDKVANVLLAYKGKNMLGGAGRAAEDIARQTAKELLGPLLSTACCRLAFVIRHIFEIAAQHAMTACSIKDNLQPYVAFHAALRSAYHHFLGKLEEQTKLLMQHHLDSVTSEFAVNLLASLPDESSDDELNGPGDKCKEERRKTHMTVPETPSPETDAAKPLKDVGNSIAPGRYVDNSPSKGRVPKSRRVKMASVYGSSLFEGRGSYEEVILYAERLFGKIRRSVAAQVAPTTLKAAFLDPVHDQLSTAVAIDLFAVTDQEFMGMFTAAGAVHNLQAKRDVMQRRLDGLQKCRTEFAELAKML